LARWVVVTLGLASKRFMVSPLGWSAGGAVQALKEFGPAVRQGLALARVQGLPQTQRIGYPQDR
jgi:hypothetical protein